MKSAKISISLHSSLIEFIDRYKDQEGYKSRSAVIESALQLLQDTYLESAYREANSQIDSDWEITANDGLTDETW